MHLRNRNYTTQYAPYATLSHCWGQGAFNTLRRSNMELFEIEVPDDALSQTILDAICVAHKSGVHYIWVDTLCITQDDDRDWMRESSMMSSVYGGSSLNIAATAAENGADGLFFPRARHWRSSARVNSLSYDVVPYSYIRLLQDMPLMQRGWVLQERCLPARTLHFTATEVFWECHHHSASETFPQGLPIAHLFKSNHYYKKPLHPSLWTWVVRTYSGCKLTFPRDRMVAISGLAERIKE